MAYNVNDELEAAAREFGGGGSSGNFYKIAEGNDNVVRVMTRGVTYASQRMGVGQYRTLYGKEKGDPLRSVDDFDAKFDGRITAPLNKEGKAQKPSIRSVYYIIDRKDNRIKQAEFPYSVGKQIGALQQNPDYFFEDFPMPYDIRITYNKTAPPAEQYSVDASPKGGDPTAEQHAELAERVAKYPLTSVVEKKKAVQMDEDMRRGIWISPEELQKAADDFNATMATTAKKQRSEVKAEETITYPSEDINPEDIPF